MVSHIRRYSGRTTLIIVSTVIPIAVAAAIIPAGVVICLWYKRKCRGGYIINKDNIMPDKQEFETEDNNFQCMAIQPVLKSPELAAPLLKLTGV